MGELGGFMKHQRAAPTRRPVPVRLQDWKEVYEPFPEPSLKAQAGRCMDCGIPFCHNGCPLGNLIPEWNDLVVPRRLEDAIERLHATNNFPEFTGRLCPAPCEGACVLGINDDPVTIKLVENTIIDRAWDEGPGHAGHAQREDGQAGRGRRLRPGRSCRRAAAHPCRPRVTVYERADRIGGLLRYGIPEFKMEKWVLDRRLAQMEAEGTVFVTNAWTSASRVIRPQMICATLRRGGPGRRRHRRRVTFPCPAVSSRASTTPWSTSPRRTRCKRATSPQSPIDATGKHVIIIGGGDTGADCLGTAHRQGAATVHQFEILPRPPDERAVDNPWPLFPFVYKVTSRPRRRRRACVLGDHHRLRSATTTATSPRCMATRCRDGRRPSSKRSRAPSSRCRADLVFLAMGFLGPEKGGLLEQFGVELDGRGNVARDAAYATEPTVCSSPATWAGARASSCGPSPKDAAPLRPSTRSRRRHDPPVAAPGRADAAAGHRMSGRDGDRGRAIRSPPRPPARKGSSPTRRMPMRPP